MQQATERLEDLVRRGVPPGPLFGRLNQAISSRGDAEYTRFGHGLGADIRAAATSLRGDEIPEALLEDARAWILYTEEGMLLEYLEGHYPASMRELWTHISRGGLFADHLEPTRSMVEEGVCSFNTIRQWTATLSDLLPDARKRRKREPRWLQVLEQWLYDVRDELQHLLEAGWEGGPLLQGLVARAQLRGNPEFGENRPERGRQTGSRSPSWGGLAPRQFHMQLGRPRRKRSCMPSTYSMAGPPQQVPHRHLGLTVRTEPPRHGRASRPQVMEMKDGLRKMRRMPISPP